MMRRGTSEVTQLETLKELVEMHEKLLEQYKKDLEETRAGERFLDDLFAEIERLEKLALDEQKYLWDLHKGIAKIYDSASSRGVIL